MRHRLNVGKKDGQDKSPNVALCVLDVLLERAFPDRLVNHPL